MKAYAGIDLHSSNNFIGIINEQDQRLFPSTLAMSTLFTFAVKVVFFETVSH